jgi:hypothetical protein
MHSTFAGRAAMVLAGFLVAVCAEAATFMQASVQPAQPTTADAITLVVTKSATPIYTVREAPDTVSISSTTIDITYAGVATAGYLQPPFTLQVPLGQLPYGYYTVNVYVQPVAAFGGAAIGSPKLELSYQFPAYPAPANYGPRVYPSPIVSGAQLRFVASLPYDSCHTGYQIDRLATIGNDITVDYTAFPYPLPVTCFDVPLPMALSVPLGSLPAGDYTIRADGAFRGASQTVPNNPITASFTVLPAPLAGVEYYWPAADHYFVTADPGEIAALDTGRFPGWVRTGQTFNVMPSATPLSESLSPVCRFYGRPEAGLDSHFYSASPTECQGVIDRFSNAWIYESGDVFVAYLPDPATGSCPSNTTPLYRVYDNRSDVNHRYTTSIDIRSQMINAGWLPEGYGLNAVAMCVL